MSVRHVIAVLISSSLALSAACKESPTDVVPHDAGPTFAKGGVPGPPGGGDDDGGGDDGGSSTTLALTFADRADDAIRSDGKGAYVDGECEVDLAFNLTDLRMDLGERLRGNSKKTCSIGTRTIVVDLGGGDVRTSRFFTVEEVETITGTNVATEAALTVPGCNVLRFDPDNPFFPDNGSDRVLVSFDDQGDGDPANDTWTIETADTDGDGVSGEAFCSDEGRLVVAPFSTTLSSQ